MVKGRSKDRRILRIRGPDDMDIHHYTRASNLPLILQSGKIRFSRADQLDDGSEMPFKTAHLDARNFFVSSWTYSVTEHSGQWFRYGNQHQGIKITLPSNPFDFHHINFELRRDCVKPSLKGMKVGIRVKDVIVPFSVEDMLGNGYIITPYADNMSKVFGGVVEYVAFPAQRAADLISENNGTTRFGDCGRLGRVKSDAWADQSEYRFVLMATEGPQLDRTCSESNYDEALFNIYERNLDTGSWGPSSAKHIDLPLSKSAIDKMQVTLGSNISDEDRELVICAINSYAPSIHIKESCMSVRI